MAMRDDRRMLLFIVYVALLLDNMLLTTVIPIIPEYLFGLWYPKIAQAVFDSGSSGTGTEVTIAGSPELERSLNATKVANLLESENIYVGLMFGSKAVVQLLTNPFIGPITNRIGYTVPMFIGFVIMFFSTLVFAFGESYAVLWVARAVQGVGSACTSTAGMGMLAQAYPDDEERGSAMGIALGGLALGVLAGPAFGGILYGWFGKAVPFLILAGLTLFDGTLLFVISRPHIDRGEPSAAVGSGMKDLIRDPYILIAAGALAVGNLGIATLEATLPLHMMNTMGVGPGAIGIAFLPSSIAYLIGANIFGPLAHKFGRWLCGLIGLVVIGIALGTIPFTQSLLELCLPLASAGLSLGMIDASVFPLMGHLVDLRHVGVYGSIYALADIADCLAFALGPIVGGPMVSFMHFAPTLFVIAVMNLLYAPLMFFLKSPPGCQPETEGLIGDQQASKLSQQMSISLSHGQLSGNTAG